MRNSKFLLTSLLAAATMVSVPAWADEITSGGRTISTDTSVDQIYFSASGTLTIDAGAVLTITGSEAKAESANSAAADRSSFSFGNTSRATINVNGTLNLLEASGFGTVWGTMGMIVGNGGVANLKALTVSAVWSNNNSSSVTLETGGTLNLGEGGYKKQYVGASFDTSVINLTLNGGTLGALDSWSTSDALTASGDVTINTTKYDATNKAYLSGDGAGATISANGGLAGTGKFIISGLGSVSTTNVSVASLEIASGASMTISGALSSASVSNAGTLDLSGVSVTGLTSEIVNTGTITVSNGTIFDLTDSLKTAEGVYTLISNSGSGNITNWTADILSKNNFTLAGEALSGRTQITLGTGSVTLSGEAYNLFWKGGDGTWDTTTAANFGKDSVSGDDTAFVAGDNVTFSSSATVAVSSGISAKTVYVTGEGTVLTLSNQANLTAKSINIASGAKLDLGLFGNGVNVVHHLTGSGEISFQKTGDNHDHRIDLGTEFTGTINYGGTLNPTNAILGAAAARVNFTNVDFWSNNGNATLAQTLNFSGESNRTRGGTLTLTGPISFSKNSLFKVEAGTLHISGSVTDASITQTGGTLNISLSRDSTIKSLTQTSGSFNVTSGTTKFQGDSSITRVINYGTTRVENGATLSITGAGTNDNGSLNYGIFEVGAGSIVSFTADFKGSAWANRDDPKTVTVEENATLNVGGFLINASGLLLTNNGMITAKQIDYASQTGWGTEVNNVSGSGYIVTDKFKIYNQTKFVFQNNRFIIGALEFAANGDARFGNATFGAKQDWTSDKAIALTGNAGTEATTTVFNTGAFDAETKTFSETTGHTITLGGVLSGKGGIEKAGAGTLKLSGNNIFEGGVTISGGRVVAASAGALGSGKTTVESGAELGLVAETTVTVTNGIDLASGAKLVVDMTGQTAGTEDIVLTLISNTALKYNENAFDSNCTSLLGSVVILENLSETLNAWTKSLSYSGNTLQLTMTIPEPSVFGLLAGLGALALAGTRRRRKKA